MAMKDIRQSVNSFTIKALLVLLVLSFVSFYGYSNVKGCNPSAVAKIRGRLITEERYLPQLRMQVESYRKILNRDLDEATWAAVQKGVLDRMINAELLQDEADKMMVSVGDDGVKRELQRNFGNPKTGEFDVEFYKRYVNYKLRSTPKIFEKQIRGDLAAQRMQNLILGSVKVSEEEAEQRYIDEKRQVNLAFLSVDPEKIELGKGSDEKEIKKFFERNKDKYRADPKRKIEYLVFDPSNYVEDAEEKVKAFYEESFRGKKEYDAKRIRARHILVKEEGIAKEIRSRVARGEDLVSWLVSTIQMAR